MPMKNLTRRHRMFALAGVAAVAAPLALVPVFDAGTANAESNAPTSAQTRLPDNYEAPVKSYAPIVQAVKPAVVTVTTKIENQNTSADNGGMTPFQPGSPMDQFFRQFFGQNGENGQKPIPRMPHRNEEALGSGFIINSNGTIVTNNHVVAHATSVEVTLDNGDKYDAKIIGRDPKTDLAVLKIDAGKQLPTVGWGDSNTLHPGDHVLALGNPFGIGTTVTAGIVSARGRDLHSGPYDDFIQVDAAINHGNSGGPLIGMDGKVVGINSAIYSPNGGNVGVGFAIPSDQASQIVSKLIQNGSINRGFIGVEIQPVTEDVANAIGLKSDSGALVASVGKDTPAEKAGIKTGDVITAFNKQEVKGPRDLARKVADVAPGDTSTISVWRNGENKDMPITVTKYKNDMTAMNSSSDNSTQQGSEQGFKQPKLGFSLAEITPDARQNYSLSKDAKGALIDDVDPDKVAADHGIKDGDVVISVNQQSVTSASDANKLITEAQSSGRKSVLLLIQRSGKQSFVALPFGKA